MMGYKRMGGGGGKQALCVGGEGGLYDGEVEGKRVSPQTEPGLWWGGGFC